MCQFGHFKLLNPISVPILVYRNLSAYDAVLLFCLGTRSLWCRSSVVHLSLPGFTWDSTHPQLGSDEMGQSDTKAALPDRTGSIQD